MQRFQRVLYPAEVGLRPYVALRLRSHQSPQRVLYPAEVGLRLHLSCFEQLGF